MLDALAPVHVAGGTLGVLSGFVALYTLKGATLHRRSGTVFVYAMLVMSLSGTLMAIGRTSAAMNVPAGLVTAYLVVTALLAVRPVTPRSRQLEHAAMLAAVVVGLASLVLAFVSGARGNPGFIAPLLMFATLALAAASGDRRMLRAGGLRGARRIARHLWRMSVALCIASASFFLGPMRRIPEPLRIPVLRLIPLIVLLTMAYWLWRYRRRQTPRPLPGTTAPEAI